MYSSLFYKNYLVFKLWVHTYEEKEKEKKSVSQKLSISISPDILKMITWTEAWFSPAAKGRRVLVWGPLIQQALELCLCNLIAWYLQKGETDFHFLCSNFLTNNKQITASLFCASENNHFFYYYFFKYYKKGQYAKNMQRTNIICTDWKRTFIN